MQISMLTGKIHRAVVTEADLEYMGSITIDGLLLKAAGIRPHQKVTVVNNNNGARLETYAMVGKEGSGIICLNGASARLAQKGDVVIIMAFAEMTPEEADVNTPKVVFVDKNNHIVEL